MQIVTRRLPQRHTILLHGDQHIGASTCHEGIIEAIVERIRSTPNCYGLAMGDMLEAIDRRDPRYDPEEHQTPPMRQWARARELYRPVARRMIAILSGNHDDKLRTNGGGDLIQQLCEDLQVPYGTYSAKVHIQTPGKPGGYKIFAWHGAKQITSNAKDPEQRAANIKASVTRKLAQQATDCHVMAVGHYHRLLAYRPPAETALWDDGESLQMERGHRDQPMNVNDFHGARYIDANQRWYCVTGTAKKSRALGHSTWEERMGFPPADLGWVELTYDKGQLSLEPVFWEGDV